MSDATHLADNPWPGLASYTEDQRHLFFGRTAEINEVVRLVQRETLTVLFGRSGLGKSSLLRAGVMPRLRESGFFPIALRLDFSERAEVTPAEQFKALTVAAARQAGVEIEGLPDGVVGTTLWEWFHAVEFWGPRNDPVTPILALDQFEEVFTLGRNLPQTEAFIEQLADLIENRVPQAVRHRAEEGGERLPYDAARQNYKVVLSLREDFVPKLDGLRPLLPAIMRNRFALAPLDAECACAVVLGAGRRWISEDDARVIVAAVVGGNDAAGGDAPLVYRPDEEVEPAYLSVMCHELFRRMQALGRGAITRDLIVAERGGILEGLYARSFEGIDDTVRYFVEDRLLTPSGFRGTLPLADATREGIAAADLHTLVDRRLLRFEDRLGTIHLELSHDLLTRIVSKRRESRRAEETLKRETERARKLRAAQLAQRRRARVLTGVAAVLAFLLIGTVWGGYYCFLQEHQAYYRALEPRRGFPVGIGELSGAQARRLALHYVLVYKGLAWDGWRPHWKPTFRMMAMDGRGKLTAAHGVGTFFWRSQDNSLPNDLNRDRGATLGLSAVCQWEYVPDAQGDIAYERGLDRNGRMIYACAYSPTASGSSSARIAHYVGPDGFPQLQNKSAAEYIEIHYDADGWEERILFLDAMARPAIGPDGAFGVAKTHDRQGSVTSQVSLGQQGQRMIDSGGNAGLRATYNRDGEIEEITSVGTNGEILAAKDGWARIRDTYDEQGRLILLESFDVNDRPVLRQSNFSGIKIQYDEHGHAVLRTYLGTDGKPVPAACESVADSHEFDAEGNEVRVTFLDRDGKPTRGRDGSCGFTSAFDASGNLRSRTFIGSDGKPFLLGDGVAGWRSEFDELGREVRRTEYGTAGEPAMYKEGFGGWETRYDSRGNAVRYTYLGLDGKPAFGPSQVAGWEAEFDPRGREIRRSYFGPAGEPVLHEDGNHVFVTSYDERGYVADTTYLDLGDKPIALANDFATTRQEHDAQGRETRRTYLDAAGKPVLHSDGYYGTRSDYDERGNLIGVTTFGLDGKPVAPGSKKYVTERRRYDLRGNLVERWFLDADGNASPDRDGVFRISKRYDVQGQLVEERSLDGNGQPMLNKSGVCYTVFRNDSAGNQDLTSTFGLHDEPVPGFSKACAVALRYDERNNLVESTFLGADGKPTVNADGYSIVRARYDERSNPLDTAYFGAHGEPVLYTDKTHRVLRKYDSRGRVMRWDYLGVKDEPVLAAGGYAAIDVEHDGRGKETHKTYLGVDGKPVELASGYASFKQSYCPSGQLARTEYFRANGENALCETGDCSYAAEYDEAGQLIARTWVGIPGLTPYQTAREIDVNGLGRTRRYFDADGRPVDNAYGYSQQNIERDDSGAMIRVVYLDPAGKPTYGDKGYVGAELVSKAWKYYDADGSEMADVEHDGVRPMLCITFLKSHECIAAKSGLLPGDIIWETGDFSFPQALETTWEKNRDLPSFQKAIFAAWKNGLYSSRTAPVRLVVIRAGRLVELNIAAIPTGVIGVNLALRCLPTPEYAAMVSRLGQPASSR